MSQSVCDQWTISDAVHSNSSYLAIHFGETNRSRDTDRMAIWLEANYRICHFASMSFIVKSFDPLVFHAFQR